MGAATPGTLTLGPVLGGWSPVQFGLPHGRGQSGPPAAPVGQSALSQFILGRRAGKPQRKVSSLLQLTWGWGDLSQAGGHPETHKESYEATPAPAKTRVHVCAYARVSIYTHACVYTHVSPHALYVCVCVTVCDCVLV